MALTALDIFKNLPKTNCKECGVPTCLAFAMQLAGKKVELDKCPHVTQEAKNALESASTPPIKLITIGDGEKKIELGNETVLFRHEETFYHEPGIAVLVSDSLDKADLVEKVKTINSKSYERVGFTLYVNFVALSNDSGDSAAFADAAETAQNNSQLPIILMTDDPASMKAAAEKIKEKKPLLYGITADNIDSMAVVAAEMNLPAVISAPLDDLPELSQKAQDLGAGDLILEPVAGGMSKKLEDLTRLRRAQLKKNLRVVGFPFLVNAVDKDDPYMEINRAACYVAKYASIVIISGMEDWQLLSLLTVRQNIYTDPQKPVQVKPGVWTVGDPGPDSPVLVTTNFSLTYYTVEGEVSSSRVPSYILVIDTEGTSVLTAWAAEKFTVEMIADILNQDGGIKEKVSRRRVIIPGLVAVMTAKLKDESGWDVIVGPREAMGIPKFLKSLAV
ncbi:MAG: acetyl-CoA decarbonylase/synthase complex subunit gamma [Candidatus Latescibacteria bacterium]|jgi:acetyl-CoA decarbonylase/synthase, CODH/ACS complex subunit gamma|nr:acetyl-CoA decarbonylase/synthase complex subunit gamma [Candidatus Latescibacterota bacterium]